MKKSSPHKVVLRYNFYFVPSFRALVSFFFCHLAVSIPEAMPSDACRVFLAGGGGSRMVLDLSLVVLLAPLL